METELSIGELARRTGLRPATLRMWESRYAFPDAVRSSGGQRRFDESTVDLVRAVLARRDAGLSLPAAIEQVRTTSPADTASLFAALQRFRPELPRHTLPKRALIPISHAIEDECCARGASAVVLGSFQHEERYREAEGRWRELARTARISFVLADFTEPARRRRAPAEIPVDPDHPMLREWAVLIYGRPFCAAMVAWELPGQTEEQPHCYETLWTTERAAVRHLLAVASTLVTGRLAELHHVLEQIDEVPTSDAAEREAAQALTSRMVGYLGARLGGAR